VAGSEPPLLQIPLESTAVLVVDMQNGFCHPEGAVGARLDITRHQAVVPRVAELVRLAHRLGLRVFWSRQEHWADDASRPRHRLATHLAKLDYIPCLRNSWDSELLDEMKALVGEDDVVFTKHRASAFYNTTLEVALRMAGIDTLVICGVTTNYCVDSTIRDAYARDFDLLIVDDACGAPWPEIHEAVMKTAAIFHGTVVSTAEALAALDAAAQPA
jgi:ureidoacrylate peracid hydrolase